MNKFLKKLAWDKDNYVKAVSPRISPMIQDCNLASHCEYFPEYQRTRYHLKLSINIESFLNGNQENNPIAKEELRQYSIKRLHHELFGDVESYIHELLFYLHTEDCEKAIEVVKLMQAAIRGEQ